MFTEGVAVMTLNGLITIGDLPPKEWASQIDQNRFQKKIDEYQDGAIIVGSGTVGKDPQWYVDRALQGGPKRVVLTSRPED
jgi:riboflavin biosynthesis pyrimidine reductase